MLRQTSATRLQSPRRLFFIVWRMAKGNEQDESPCGNSHIMRLALRLRLGIGQFPGLSYAGTTNTPDTRDMQICHPVNQTENTYKGVK